MKPSQFFNLCVELYEIIKKHSPIDTGNLRFNAIKFAQTGKNEITIYVNTNIAPYMVFTNEPWISPKWNGKKNPNEAWWNNLASVLATHVAKKLKAKVVIL